MELAAIFKVKEAFEAGGFQFKVGLFSLHIFFSLFFLWGGEGRGPREMICFLIR